MVFVAICMTMLLAAAAYTIDLGAGRQGLQKAQSAADAAALAAADVITTSSPSTNQPAVTTAGLSVATTNLPGSRVSVVMPSTTAVKVTVSSNSSNSVGGLFGSNDLPVSASAVASLGSSNVTTTGTTITTGSTVTATTVAGAPSAGNVGLFAADTSCDGGFTVANSLLGTGGLLNGLTAANNVNLSGTSISNGNLWLDSANLASNNGTYSYGGPNGCSFSGSNLANNNTKVNSTSTYGFPVAFTSPYANCPSITNGAIDYTATVLNPTIPAGIYCSNTAVNLTIVAASVSLSGVTIIAPQINIYSAAGFISSWSPNSAAPSNALALATGAGGLTINMVVGNAQNLSGVLAATAGTINFSANTIGGTGLMEGQQLHLDAANINWTGNAAAATSAATTSTRTVATVATVTTTGTVTTTTTGVANLSN